MFYDPIKTAELSPVPAGWFNQPEIINSHLESLKSLLTHDWGKPITDLPYGGKASEYGVLYIGGGAYWPGIVVGIRMLRQFGCNLPVQVWHRGDDEPINVDQIKGLGDVTVIDIRKHAASMGGARILRGWECKLWALSYCGFEKVLYLDADAYVVSNPASFLLELDNAPFVFWNDLPFNYGTVRWQTVWPSGDFGVPAIQGGQLAIDRVKAWPTVMLSHWMNQHSDFYYSHMFGDQDTWRVALAAQADRSLWASMGAAPWQNTAFVCPTRDGVKTIVHRCQGKLFRPKDIPVGKQAYSSPQYSLPMEALVFNHLSELLQQDVGSCETVFGDVYRNKLWGEGSGPGSLGEEAQIYVNLVNTLLEWGNIESVVDLGTGDGKVVSNLKVKSVVAVDCCKDQVEKSKAEFPEISWRHLDFYSNRELLPKAEIAFMKDVLHHWPTSMIIDWISWAKTCGKWKKLILTQDVQQPESGMDCHLGGYRALDHRMEPLKQLGLKLIVKYLHKAMYVLECGA
jgi:hypothetical protein